MFIVARGNPQPPPLNDSCTLLHGCSHYFMKSSTWLVCHLVGLIYAMTALKKC